jgi:DNA-directed RNA polymerase
MLWDKLSHEQQQERLSTQSILEEETLLNSVQKYWKEYDRAPDEGIPEQKLLDDFVSDLAPAYQDWIDKVSENPKCPAWVYPLFALGSHKMADITLRSVMRLWLNSASFKHDNTSFAPSPPLAQHVVRMISKDALNIIAYQNAKENNAEFWRKQSKFIKNWSEKRCIAFANKVGSIPDMTLKQKDDFGHHMLRIAEASGIIKTTKKARRRGRGWTHALHVEFNPAILMFLSERHKLMESSMLVYRPMITPPVDHKLNASGGYIHHWIRKDVVHRYVSEYVEDKTIQQKHSEPSQFVLDGLNAMQRTEWSVNSKVLAVMEDLFKSNSRLANLPAYEFDQFLFSIPYPEDGTKEEQAKWCQNREESYGEWFKQEQARARMLVRLALAKRLQKHGFFYHVMTLDFRGRCYTTCELLSNQSSDYDRALIQFAEPVKQTSRGLYWLKVHVANLFDQDKLSFDERVVWVDDNVKMLEKIYNDPYSNLEWVSDKKKKNPSFQRLAAIFELFRTDGMTQLPIQMDGACNGSQHWSAIMGDATIAGLTNVLPDTKPNDLYQYVADKTTDYCRREEGNGWCPEFLSAWPDGIHRNVTKRPTMCDAYGLTFYGIQKYIKLEGHVDWVPKEKQSGAIVELARAIQSGLGEALHLPNIGKEWLKECAEIVANAGYHLEYTVPSGFKVVHAYYEIKKRRSLASLFNHKELIFWNVSKDVHKDKAMLGIPPNYIHSLDASHMFCTVKRMVEAGIIRFSMIHDSYGCPAPYVDIMNNLIREEFLKMHKENQLETFKRCVEATTGVTLPDVPDRGSMELGRVLDSQYFFS